jgi:hypothetical protein
MSETVVGHRSARDCAAALRRPGTALAELRIQRYTVGRSSLHGSTFPTRQMLMTRLAQIAPAVLTAVAIAGCGLPTQTTNIAGGPAPVTVRLEPATPTVGQSAALMVTSPHADSIAFESENGLDRYWTTRDTLRVQLDPNFGDSLPTEYYAARFQGELLSRLMKPARITVCRAGNCESMYYEIPVGLPEANHRTVAVTAGYNTVFARRSLVGSHSTVLFREALSSGIWSAQAELSDHRWSGRVAGYAGRGERGASLDLSRMLKRGGDLSYGVAMHLDADRSEWLPEGEAPVVADRTAWRVGLGPSVMMRGVTATSQLGIYNDGVQTLQIVSTRVSLNGNLTEVRLPVSLSAEKTFAFGGGAIVSRRRDDLERLMASVHVVDAFALNFGMSSHRSAWPGAQPVDDFRASETLFTLGGQYTLSW